MDGPVAVDSPYLLAGNLTNLFSLNGDEQLITTLTDLGTWGLNHQHLAIVTARAGWLQGWGLTPACLRGKLQSLGKKVTDDIHRPCHKTEM